MNEINLNIEEEDLTMSEQEETEEIIIEVSEDGLAFESKKVVAIRVGFENMDAYLIPAECIKEIEITQLEDVYRAEFACRIVDNGKIKSKSRNKKLTFAQRVDEFADIAQIKFYCEDGSKHSSYPIWYYGESKNDYYRYDEENEYQEATFHSYNEVEFTICKSNKTYKIGEVLDIGKNEPTKFKDEFGIVYKAKEGLLFIMDSDEPVHLTLEILNTKFTKVD